ncbi:MAG TPA: FtsX-like permease family protein [Polyangia bacterium]|jgi:putative ABC transport system permease protein|nr:FtsX-like permease family protein [Polyangia bacterium]
MMVLGDIGPIWRSTVRHRAFGLLVLEVVVVFVVIANMLVTSRWFVDRVRIPTGHRENDLVDVLVRRPSQPGSVALVAQHQRELAVLANLPGALAVAPVSSTQGDDLIANPNLFWTGAPPLGGEGCDGIERGPNGAVVGWGVEGGVTLPDVLDLQVVEGGSFSPVPEAEGAPSVLVTACLARALFGATNVVGRTLLSNRYPPARVAGVLGDVRMHVPFLPQTQVTAIYPGLADDGRQVDYLIRTAPGQAAAVRDAAAAALPPQAGGLVRARVFSAAGPRMVLNAYGSVKVFSVIGGGIALAALLGNVTLAALVVASRRRIIGIRRALGATRLDVFRTLWIETLIPAVLGSLIGLPLTLLMVSQGRVVFPGLRLTVADVGVTLFVVALVGVPAKLFPALQATRVPPSEVGRAL